MDRWNELIAGHVLGNLTAEESEELAQVLAEHPHLNEEILRLRQTATLKGGLLEGRMADRTSLRATPSTSTGGDITAGAEGWSDRISGSPSTANLNERPIAIHSILELKKHELQGRSQPKPSSSANPTNKHNSYTWGNAYAKSPLKKPLKNPLWWILVLITIALGIDNVRVRRSLARIGDKTTYTNMKEPPPSLWTPSEYSTQ